MIVVFSLLLLRLAPVGLIVYKIASVTPFQLTRLPPQLLTRSSLQRRIFQATLAVVATMADQCPVHKRQCLI